MMKNYLNEIIQGNSFLLIDNLEDNTINLILTSPPYFGARVYGNETLGREEDPNDYVKNY